MNLAKKKLLATKVLKVGKARVIFDENRLDEIKEAITKQDIKDLYKSGVIKIRERKGRKKVEKRKKRGEGKRKKILKNRKENYVIITKKLRKHIKELKKQGRIDKKIYQDLRKKISAKRFASKTQLKEFLKEKK